MHIEIPNNKSISSFYIFDTKVRGQKINVGYFWPANPGCGLHNLKGNPEFYKNEFELMTSNLTELIRPGSTVIDIGCRDGDTTLPLAYMNGEHGTTIAIDPNPIMFKNLLLNISANPAIKIDPFNTAITESDGEFTFGYESEMFNGGRLTRELLVGNFPEIVNLNGITVETFQKNNPHYKYNDISFIKLDTEGYDYKILLFLENIIKESKPNIQTEWWPCSEKEMEYVFDRINYQAYNPATKEKLILKLENRIHDILLLPK